MAQTLQDFEIIAVDDCSTDDSWRILREYERKHADKVRSFRHEVNKKQGGARNTGLEHAAGEWVGFIDSDDWI
ncbi:glycosyltransferase family 2 protein, partial [Acinetobacter pittii]|uniref:glycosyltransferase family 2 protein n=1 Tax=Acinetobacter pittii TaxID=48296 RepID=UPI00332810C3